MTSTWVSRESVRAYAAFDEDNLSDNELNTIVHKTTNDVKGLFIKWGIRDYEHWVLVGDVPTSIRLAIIYGVIAALWAERPELFASTGFLHEQNAMEYWETRFEKAMAQFLRMRGIQPVRVRELVSSIRLPFE